MQNGLFSKFFFTSVLVLSVALSLSSTYAQSNRQQVYNLKNNVAIQGYDPVSYFQNNPQKGQMNFKLVHQGVTYYFVNAQNLNTFKANPEKYEPQYGGWCAYAMGKDGSKVNIDPKTYKIHNGKLYLFYNAWGNNTLNSWNKDEANLMKKADASWAKIIK